MNAPTAANKTLAASLKVYYQDWRATLANEADLILPEWEDLNREQILTFMDLYAATVQVATAATRTLLALGVEMPDEP